MLLDLLFNLSLIAAYLMSLGAWAPIAHLKTISFSLLRHTRINPSSPDTLSRVVTTKTVNPQLRRLKGLINSPHKKLLISSPCTVVVWILSILGSSPTRDVPGMSDCLHGTHRPRAAGDQP